VKETYSAISQQLQLATRGFSKISVICCHENIPIEEGLLNKSVEMVNNNNNNNNNNYNENIVSVVLSANGLIINHLRHLIDL
jgi:hypothetical protein